MRQGRSTGTPTKAEAARMDAIAGSDCLACLIRQQQGLQGSVMPATVHHLTIGGRHGQKRRGHRYTVGLCAWHHQGYCPEAIDPRSMAELFGPSYALSPAAFRREIGNDDLLLSMQDEILAESQAA